MRSVEILEVKRKGDSVLAKVLLEKRIPIVYDLFGFVLTEENTFMRSQGFWYFYPQMRIVEDRLSNLLEEKFNGRKK